MAWLGCLYHHERFQDRPVARVGQASRRALYSATKPKTSKGRSWRRKKNLRNTFSHLTNAVWLLVACLTLAGMRSASAESPVPSIPPARTAQATPFKGWSSLGKPASTYLSGPVRGVNADGRQELFATSPFVWHAWQTSPNGTWSDWAQHGYLQALCLAIRSNADGRMEVFALEQTARSVWHTWQVAPNSPFQFQNGFPYWENFGWPLGSVRLYCPLAAGQHADGRVDLFGVGEDGNLWSRSQVAPSDGWASWFNIGKPGGVTISSPAWGFDSSGHQFVFLRGSDNAIYMTYQTTPDTDAWTWFAVGQPSGVNLGAPAIGWNNDQRMELFAIGDDGNLWHRYQVSPSGGWTAWAGMGKPTGLSFWPYSKPLAGRYNTDGTGYKMEVFAQPYSGDFWHLGQIAPSDG